MKISRIIGLFIVILLLNACTKEPEQDIPEVFVEYVDLFFEEGKKRGFTTKLEDVNLSFEFDDLSDRGAAGLCTFSSGRIRIDEVFWENNSYLERRRVVFHELAHCVLQRRHRLESTNNGQCLSLLGVKEGDFNCSKNVYSDKWWDYYLDELFDKNTELPDWYTHAANYNSVNVISNLFQLDTIGSKFEVEEIDFSTLHNFSIEVLFNNYETDHRSVYVWFGNIVFSDCNVCTGVNVKLRGGPTKTYYHNSNGNIMFEDDIKLTIRRINEIYYFYVNERFIDILDDNLVSGSKISINQFDPPIHIQIKINELE